jgi:hypothetical protein
MAQFCNGAVARCASEFCHKLVLVDGIMLRDGNDRTGKQSLMVERRKNGTALFQRTQTVEAYCVQSLENVAIFPVLWSASMLFDKTLYFLEASDDALFSGRAYAFLFRFRKFREFCG